jgi:hypothetical protein
MSITGLAFVLLGGLIIFEEMYSVSKVDGEIVFLRKEKIERNRFYRYKMLVSIFSILLGIFRIINYFLY